MAKEIADFLDGLKENIENHIDTNFFHLHNNAVPLENKHTDKNNVGNGEEVNRLSDRAERYKAAIKILSDTTKRGYARILRNLKTQFKLQSLPTYYELTKNRPLMCELNKEPWSQLNTGTKQNLLISLSPEIGGEINEE